MVALCFITTGMLHELAALERKRFRIASNWIPGSYAPALSEKGNSFLRLLKNKGFREESMTKVGVDAIGTSTTLESNKSHSRYPNAGESS